MIEVALGVVCMACIIALNRWYRRRRARMTAAQQVAEDERDREDVATW